MKKKEESKRIWEGVDMKQRIIKSLEFASYVISVTAGFLVAKFILIKYNPSESLPNLILVLAIVLSWIILLMYLASKYIDRTEKNKNQKEVKK